jgi:AcrR family transcriptional regulator
MADKKPRSKAQPRPYDSTGRRERAREQLETTLERARDLFLDRGYAGTTVDEIAVAAGVSAATIYKTYGGKAGLVRSLCRTAMVGEGPTPAHERSDAMRIGADGRAVIEQWAALLAEVSPRISPLLLLLGSAAQNDHEAATLLDEQEADRLYRMRGNARFLADNDHLRDGVTIDEAADVLWLCSSPELYDLLVLRRGWSPEQLRQFAAQTMASALL